MIFDFYVNSDSKQTINQNYYIFLLLYTSHGKEKLNILQIYMLFFRQNRCVTALGVPFASRQYL